MVEYLVGTDSESTSERIVAYLNGRIEADDMVYVVNSLRGGDQTTDVETAEGRDALDAAEDSLDCEVETHQIVRGNNPHEDLLTFAEEHDVDELVIGIRKRNPTGKVVFGSEAQDILLNSSRPVVAVPLTE
jgi:nucleotide-binding universal stress UspA family protein